MSRLASLTPSRASLSPRSSLSPSPASTSRVTETTHHRMLKLVLSEIRRLNKDWDDLSMIDGLKAGKICVDEATEMDNILQMEDTPERPVISRHLEALSDGRRAMEVVLSKLDKLLSKPSFFLDQADKIFFEAYRTQGPEFSLIEPLWLTWTLERFIDSLPPLLALHQQQYHRLVSLADIIISPETPFEAAKLALEQWQDISRGGERWDGVRDWEELVEIEIAGYAGEVDREDDETVKGRRKKGRKG